MEHYETIRQLHRVYGKSIREIQKETGHHRATIRKALEGKEPVYRRKRPIKSSLLDSYSSVVDSWLDEDQNSPKKQRHTAKRIYDRLVEEYQFTGSESRVRQWVRKKRQDRGDTSFECMIPLVPELGKEAEIDWGEAEVLWNDTPKKIKLFVMRSRYSGFSFVRAYLNEKQVMLFDAHVKAFEYFGGIHPVLVYDNLKTAVQRVLKGKKRIEQDLFTSFRSFYNFEARFCNPGKGHEKGGVEGQIGFVRRNVLVPIPRIQSLDELNSMLHDRVLMFNKGLLQQKGKRINRKEAFEEEKKCLLRLPTIPFANKEIRCCRVDSYQLIKIETNRYSVPSAYCRCEVKAHLTCESIVIYYQNKEISKHRRSYSDSEDLAFSV